MRSTLLAAVVLAALPATVRAQDPDEGRTRMLVNRYQSGDWWAVQAITLLSLGDRWHPAGAEIVVEALDSGDERLQAYAIETLLSTNPSVLAAVATPELVDELVRRQLSESNDHYQGRVFTILNQLFPGAAEPRKAAWTNWWRKAKDEYAPAEWVPQAPPDGAAWNQSISMAAIDRAFDLHSAGLELAICLDTTGSMQPTINGARLALADMVVLLEALSPRFRLGLVHYRDLEDLGGGASVLVPLTSKITKVQNELDGLNAGGGGDAPERVEKGLELAIHDPSMRWERAANKIVVVIGDAPPHPRDIETAIDLARQAYQLPFGEEPNVRDDDSSRSSSRGTVRPFVTAAIGVGQGRQGTPGQTASALRRIAEAGGGAYADLNAVGGEEGAKRAARQIVAHMLRLSFGAEFADEMDRFVEVYFDYRDAGFIR